MRKKRAEKRYLKPDPKFNDILVSKFINYMMWDGKKSVARRVIYDSFDLIEQKNQKACFGSFQKSSPKCPAVS